MILSLSRLSMWVWLISIHCLDSVVAKEAFRFGPFFISTRSFDKNCRAGVVDKKNEIFNTLTVKKIGRYRENLSGDIVIKNDLYNITSTMLADFWRDGGFKPFYSRKVKNACDDSFMIFIMYTFFKVGNGCYVKKGNYSVTGIDPNEVFHRTVGKNFFYEKISFTMIIFTPNGMVACLKFSYESKPLNKEQKAMNFTFGPLIKY